MENNLPDSIREIINELNKFNFITNTIVSSVISSVNISEKDLLPFSFFTHPNSESYGRRMIADNGKFKIMLMSWRAGDFTAIHNHGYTEWGCVHFLGNATHRLYEIKNGLLQLVKNDSFSKGETANMSGELIHMMGNAREKEFLTLHIYGSNTRTENISGNAKVYVPEKKKIIRTAGSAYLNMKEELILAEEDFSGIESQTLADYLPLVKPFYERNKQDAIVEKINTIIKNQKCHFQIH